MTLQRIRIVNVKGIQNKTFTLNIIPNKPSLLYATNGFGKSSFAIAFDSLNNRRMDLSNENLYANNAAHRPILELRYLRPDNSVIDLQADDANNTIKNEFDYFVINNQVRAKSSALKFGGKTVHTASLHIDAFVLINAIPANIKLVYTVNTVRGRFGSNGKILPNLTTHISNGAFLSIFQDHTSLMDQLGQVRNSKLIQHFKDRINHRQGSTEDLLDWIEANELVGLDAIVPLCALTDQLMALDLGFTRRCERVLAVLEMVDLYLSHKVNFKAACERRQYELERDSYVVSFRAFNATWKDIQPRERDGQLIIEFPKAHHISNGQRDILCLIAMLEQARLKFKKQAAILIIDEVFDYLDEANLLAAQYYVSEFIEDFKKGGRRIYPLILTHLNPGFFKNYSFSKLKVYCLDQRTPTVLRALSKLIELREEPSIYTDVSMYLLHYHTGQINKRTEFTALGLRPTWGEGNHFVTYINLSVQVYLNNQPGYDPFAVCCALRRRVEENIFTQIGGAPEKARFLSEHGTNEKFDYARSIGVVVPEYYYLLGIVYNDGMHWKPGRDNESPLKAKLENGVVRNLIVDVFR